MPFECLFIYINSLWTVFGFSLDFPCGSAGKESACNAGGLGSIPGLARSPGGGWTTKDRYCCWGNDSRIFRLIPKEERSTERWSNFGHPCVFFIFASCWFWLYQTLYGKLNIGTDFQLSLLKVGIHILIMSSWWNSTGFYFGLGYVICFGQWNISGCDANRGLNYDCSFSFVLSIQ